MKVKCIARTGEALRQHEYDLLEKNVLGRFGATSFSEYGILDVGKEYQVMGLVIYKSYQGFLIDDSGMVSVCPCQLFEIIQPEISSDWYFRMVARDEEHYPFVQAIAGYYELCFDKSHLENLVVNKEHNATRIYFERKAKVLAN